MAEALALKCRADATFGTQEAVESANLTGCFGGWLC
jgi:hypothetical protein